MLLNDNKPGELKMPPWTPYSKCRGNLAQRQKGRKQMGAEVETGVIQPQARVYWLAATRSCKEHILF